VSELLSEHKFSQDDLDKSFFYAARYPSDNTLVLGKLLRAGADVNSAPWRGTTPLMDSATSLNMANVKFLISSGADVSKKDSSGNTAYDLLQQLLQRIKQNGYQSPTYTEDLLNLLKPS